ncbi:MAG: HU family DNA-binding protein [Alphaproteobacteria bacterium]|nr:HU family DNA-binding protein [Alphaproteobacteria bacterium]
MNKVDFIRAIAEDSGLTIKDAGKFLESFINVTKNTLTNGEDVVIIGFGTFSVTERSARPGRDFRTGEVIQVPASKVIKFKVGKNLKDAVNG